MDSKQNKQNKNQTTRDKVRKAESFAESAARANSDVLGSYTGIPLIDDDEMPVQDADDL